MEMRRGGCEARAAHSSPWSSVSSSCFARPLEGAEGRVLDSRLVIVGKGQFNQAVEVLEYLGIALNRCLPVLIDTPLERLLRGRDLIGMRWSVVVVVGMSSDAFQVLGMCRLASLCQQSEVLEDIVLCVCANP